MKKGQLIGQVFIYIMAIVVVGVIALIAYQAIIGIMEKSCNAEKAKFKTDVSVYIEKYTSFGSFNKRTISAPCDYEEICFVDSKSVIEGIELTQCANGIIKDSVRSKIEQNVFVVSNHKTIGIDYSSLIKTTQERNCTCIPVKNSNFYINFEGLGYGTRISTE